MKWNWPLAIVIGVLGINLSTTQASADEDAAPQGFDQPREVPHGQVKAETYDSKTLGFERKMTVYLPPGFSKDQK